MRLNILTALIGLFASTTFAADWVNGYTRSNGTYVQGHYRSSPDNTRWNNYSTQGNVNPYTGQSGHVNPYRMPSYGSSGGFGSTGMTVPSNPYRNNGWR